MSYIRISKTDITLSGVQYKIIIPYTSSVTVNNSLAQFANLAAFPATGDDGILYVALDTNKTYTWQTSVYVQTSSGASTKEDITGLKLADSPEFANIQITNLNSDAVEGGVIPVIQWTWLGATAKSVLSVLTKIIEFLKTAYDHSQTAHAPSDALNDTSMRSTGQSFNGEIDLTKYFTSYNNYQLTGPLALTVKANAIIGGFAQGIIVGDGTNTPTLTGITLDSNSSAFNAGNGIKNRFVCAKFQDAVYISYTEVA